MGSRLRKRFTVLCIVLVFGLSYGCASFQSAKSDDRVAKLEQKVENLEMLLGAGVAASFYPATGGFECDTTGCLGNITGTSDKDVGFVVIHDHTNLGDALAVYILDEDSACGGDHASNPPLYFQAADGGDECWELATVLAPGIISVVDPNGFTMTAAQAHGLVAYATGTGTINLPPVKNGMNFTIIDHGGAAITVNPDDSDYIVLDGTTMSIGEAAISTSTTGDMLVCTFEATNYWYCASGSPDGDHWTQETP